MANRLANSTSPYLLQHKENPVEWWEWSEEAFAEARRRDVPVLISIGYAACHWCHVMAHESFEDPITATEMNRLFVNVKVDREERPDVDSVYMEATQAMTGHGGWPMTVFVDHDGRPFYAGTYFPKTPHHGMPSFRQLLDGISTAWNEKRAEVSDQARRLVDAVAATVPPSGVPGTSELVAAYQKIESLFDSDNGGFGGAPKFPQQPLLEFLLRVHAESWAPEAKLMLGVTLDKMARGGIRDHLGGGFSRYSVDAGWLVPHFEKMLYDNAQLARIYLWAGVEFGRADFLEVARDTIGYLNNYLRHPNGGFYSSEDADSEGHEGKFYVWTLDEVRAALGAEAPQAIDYFGLTEGGNFEGSNILSVVGDSTPPGLVGSKARLLEVRERRIRPGLDDKVIASWNGLAIRTLAEAGAVLKDPILMNQARQTARFVLDNLMIDGRLMRSWRDGRASTPAFLDDHSSVALGMYALYSATGEIDWYRAAVDLVDQMHRFERPDGGYFTTAKDGQDLFKRPFDITDNPLPSGNALASEALFYASMFTGDKHLHGMMESAISAGAGLATRYPTMSAHHLSVAYSSARSKELAVVGPDRQGLTDVYYQRFRPHIALASAPTQSPAVPLLVGRDTGTATMAFVCRDFVCDLPTSNPNLLAEMLDS